MLVLGLECGSDHAGRGVVHENGRLQVAELLDDARRRDVAAHEHGLGTPLADLLRSLLGRGVVPHVADRDPRRAQVGEAEGGLPADPARPARDRDGRVLPDH